MATGRMPALHHHHTVESLDSVCHAGRRIYLLPARPCTVESGLPAANGAWSAQGAAPLHVPFKQRLLQWWWRAWAARRRHADLVYVGQAAIGAATQPRWPSAWPYADCGIAPGRGGLFSTGGMSAMGLAPDAIIDDKGRVLRL